jgi:RNA-binding protein 26
MQGLGGQFPNFAPFDPKAAMDAFLAMGGPMVASPQPGFPVQPLPGRRAQRCRDYDTKGYCARGNSCNFQHGEYNLFMPPDQLGSFGGPAPQPQALDGTDFHKFQFWPSADPQAEYDPTNALMAGMFGVPNFGQPFTPERGGHNQRGRGGRNQDSRKKGRPRAPFSADGPVTDKTKSTIVVESIPEENFDEEQVRGFFSQFGTVLDVSMRPYKRLAVVKFDNWAAANAAYKSPKAIFDNRFVKVFWYKEETAPQATTSPSEATAAGPAAASSTESPAIAPAIDMDEFLRKQEEAQKAHEEKMRKLEEVQRQRQELEKRQEELLVKRLEEEKKLLAKLGGASAGKDTKSAEPTSQSEFLRAKLAALEAEAMRLGIDPDAEADFEADQSWTPRGGFGRGRGYPRARGYAPRGAPHGAFRGRGGQHAAYAAYSLDNRPKKLAVSGVDFTVPGTDETLRQYLFVSLPFRDGEGDATDTHLTGHWRVHQHPVHRDRRRGHL